MTRILAFTPYTFWNFHTRYELTISAACKLRGAEVLHLRCHGDFKYCDMDIQPNGSFGGVRNCDVCISAGDQMFRRLGMEFEDIGAFITDAQRQEIADWAVHLATGDLLTARYRDLPLAEWVMSSMITELTEYPVPIERPEVEAKFRGFLQAAGVTGIALSRLIDMWKPEAVLLFNGRRSVTAAAFHLARQRGIRVITHERAVTPGTVYVQPNEPCVGYGPFDAFWNDWSEVPLTKEQCETAVRWLSDRRYWLLQTGIPLFSGKPTGSYSVRRKLGISEDTKILALFTSSMFEHLGNPSFAHATDSQSAWIDACLVWASVHPEVTLLLRVHPNVKSSASEVSYYATLTARLPANAIMVMPDSPVSSYDIVDTIDAAVCYVSTIGLEILATGKPVITSPVAALYGRTEGFLQARSAAELLDNVDVALTLGRSRERRRQALRLIYRYYYQMQRSFPLVSLSGLHENRLEYETVEELAPGRNEALDRICDYLMKGRDLYDPPEEAVRQRAAGEEARFLDRSWNDPDWLKPKKARRFKAAAYSTATSLRSIPTRIALSLPRPAYSALRALWSILPARFRRSISLGSKNS